MQKTENKIHIKSLLLLGLGTLLEWAEYTVYGYCAMTIAHKFFPIDDPTLGILKSFSVFAVGYLMRPLGAVLFGWIGDNIGRKPALMLSLILMGIAALGIGCLPTYNDIGITAPILLCVFRLLQGIAVSGEFNGAAIFLMENSKNHKTFMGAWIAASAAMGMVIGGLTAIWAQLPSSIEWAWRVPFLVGGLGALLGLLFRTKIKESYDFRTYQKRQPHPCKQNQYLKLFKQHKSSIIFVGLMGAFAGIFVYVNNIYFAVYLNTQFNYPRTIATQYAAFGEALSVIFILLFGKLGDKTNPRMIFYIGLVFTIFCSPFIFWLTTVNSNFNLIYAMTLFAILNGLTSAPMMRLAFEQFALLSRYTGISLSWSLFVAIFAGSAPMVAHTLVNYYALNPGWYVSIIGLICLIIMPQLDNKVSTIHHS